MEIALKGKHAYRPMQIDESDLVLFNGWSWPPSQDSKGYASVWRMLPGFKVDRQRVHRIIMQPKPGMVIDHINEDKLDNRRVNLRECTNRENRMNASRARVDSKTGIRCVIWAQNRWQVHVRVGGKSQYFGSFVDVGAAMAKRDEVVRAISGEFTPLAMAQ